MGDRLRGIELSRETQKYRDLCKDTEIQRLEEVIRDIGPQGIYSEIL